jgi:S-adenosylmethionine:tRNA ribosyltransferase-isomerase
MFISDYDNELPDELIARYPATDRRGSRLLELDRGISDRVFSDFASLLKPNDLLVFNDTRVIKARLAASKASGGRAEILIERVQSEQAALAHVKASKSPKPGGRLLLADDVVAEVIGRDGDLYALNFSVDVLSFLETHGEVPLPPYLGRDADSDDIERYQTVYARDPGAVAAPTAGLHFDEAMLEETREAGAGHAWVTLHVGAARFH